MKIKKAVVLAAGGGKRLDKLGTIKPLVKVGNKSLIFWCLDSLVEKGFEEVTIIVPKGDTQVKKEVLDYSLKNLNISFVEHQPLLNKEGILASILSFNNLNDESFVVTACDLIFKNNPYSNAIQEKEDVGMVISMNNQSNLYSGANSKIFFHEEIQTIGQNIENFNAFEVGIYYFTPNGYRKFCEASNSLNKLDDVFLELLSQKNVIYPVFLENGEWFDVNNPATHIRAEIMLRDLKDDQLIFSPRSNLIKLNKFSNFFRHKSLETDIIVERGLINSLDKIMIIPEKNCASKHYIITDENVDKIYGEKVLSGFLKAGYDVTKIVVPAGEESKNIKIYAQLADEIFCNGLDERSILISLGGGVINNITGFLASTLYRGVGLIHFPTTLMAQLDAAIDFKQAINSRKGKNLLGSYWPASVIAIDPDVLKTLDNRHIRNGMGEAIKHALTQDEAFLSFLSENSAKINDIEFLEKVIKKTIELKVPLLNGRTEDDFNEMLPQYGHSVGHAVEHLSAYDLLHGEALAIGMCVCAELAKLAGICNEDLVAKHYEICSKYSLPVSIPDYMSSDDICNVITYDKHFLKGTPHMALIEIIGSVWNDKGVFGVPIDLSLLRQAINLNKNKYSREN